MNTTFPAFYTGLRIRLFVLIVLALLASLFQVEAAHGADRWLTDVGANASASSYVAPYAPSRAADNSVDTYSRWYCGKGAKWLTLDLKGLYQINKWKVAGLGSAGWNSSSNIKDYSLLGSVDGTSWVTLDSVTGNSANLTERSFSAATVRYVKLNITQGNWKNNYWTSVMEFQVFGSSILPVDTPAITGVTVPVAGAVPVSSIDNPKFTGTVAWSGTPDTFKPGVSYTATILLTPKIGYTFAVVPKDFFTVEGANYATNPSKSGTVTAVFPATVPSHHTLTYAAGANGTLTGVASQTVARGDNGSAVTAVPDSGCHFVKWSDGVTTATRVDFNVTEDVNVTAEFAVNTYSLTYTAGANGSLTGVASQTVNHGGSGTAVTAVPASGYHFVKWSDNVTTATRTDTNITANLSVTAEFAVNGYALTYTAGANGSITGNASQTVNHGGSGTAVTAVPASGYHFVKWSDNVTTATRTDTNITANLSVTAEFAVNTYSLTYTAGANGSLTGNASQTVNHGGSGTAVTAVPASGYHFVKWSDNVTTATRTDTNITANLSVTAEFAVNTYSLTYTAGANGSITGNASQTVNHGGSGTAVTAVPASGYHFVKWSDNVTTATRTDTNITANLSVTAEFAVNTYSLTYTAGANGSITGNASQTVNHGGSGTAVTAVPASGYHFVKWSDNVTTATRTDTNITANLSVTAEFAVNTYSLTYTAGANGSITGNASQTVNHGGSGTAVTAVPASGYHFVKWSDNVTTATRTDTNITANLSVTAEFAVNTYSLTYTAGANGSITGNASQTVNHGGSGTAVTAVPASGYHFVKWSDNVTTATRTDTNITANLSVTAEFAVNTYSLTYTAGANGSITGNASQTVNHGGSGTAVTAVPASGYHFVKWSDNVTTATRTDTNITANLSVTAEFAVNTYSLTYTAGANGSITGNASQTVNHGGSGTAVTAVPASGYHFVKWSDNVTTATRTDTNITANLSVTAEFAVNHSSSGQQTTENHGVEIRVNGKTETAATESTKEEDGKKITTITLDDKKIDEKLQAEGNNTVVTIPAKNDTDIVESCLNGQTVKNMESKVAVLEIMTGNVTYQLPAAQINIDSISGQFGHQVELKDIDVKISISEPPENTAKIIEDTANSNNYQLVVKPIEFSITCTSGGKSIEVSKFNGYVERLVAIPDGIDPLKITTGVVLNPDGSLSHVPTEIISIDGKYFAKINSLTNSVYSVIFSPKTFKDMRGHWAEAAVNDMGSRLVITGIGKDLFKPDRAVTRGEFASIIVNGLGLMRPNTGKDCFTDVKKGIWYYDAVSIAYENGLISGYANGKFGPTDKITREQAMALIARAMKITGLEAGIKGEDVDRALKNYVDGTFASSYAKEGIAACLKAGLVTGRGKDVIAPKDNITRAETAAIIRQLLKTSELI
ncbi:hypothetical protein MASR2M70_21890 [Bacillota bacterium]